MAKFEYALRKAALAELYPIRNSVLGWIEHPLDKKRTSNHVVAIDKADAKIIAALSFGPVPPPDPKELPENIVFDGSIWRGYGLAVLPTYQKTGIGSAILDYVFREAREAGIKWLIGNARLSAVSYYQNKGAEVYGEPFSDYINKRTDLKIRFRIAEED